jgi:hypothetical protein
VYFLSAGENTLVQPFPQVTTPSNESALVAPSTVASTVVGALAERQWEEKKHKSTHKREDTLEGATNQYDLTVYFYGGLLYVGGLAFEERTCETCKPSIPP